MITYKRLRYYVSDEDIYVYYFSEYEIGKSYSSPLPFRRDSNPSFQIQMSKKGNLYWIDRGYPDQDNYSLLHLLSITEELSKENTIKKVWKDLVINGPELGELQISPKKEVKYEVVCRELRDWELTYWLDLGVPKSLLDFYNIKSLNGFSKNGNLLWVSNKDNPTYVYNISEDSYKLYRPLDPLKDKFRSINIKDSIEGWEQLPYKGSDLFINSSLKDTIITRRCGYLSCNPSSETSYNNLLNKREELSQRFENIYILFDRDRAGISSAKRLSNSTGWKPIILPFEKDPSDMVNRCGNYFYLSKFFSNFTKYKYRWE